MIIIALWANQKKYRFVLMTGLSIFSLPKLLANAFQTYHHRKAHENFVSGKWKESRVEKKFKRPEVHSQCCRIAVHPSQVTLPVQASTSVFLGWKIELSGIQDPSRLRNSKVPWEILKDKWMLLKGRWVLPFKQVWHTGMYPRLKTIHQFLNQHWVPILLPPPRMDAENRISEKIVMPKSSERWGLASSGARCRYVFTCSFVSWIIVLKG